MSEILSIGNLRKTGHLVQNVVHMKQLTVKFNVDRLLRELSALTNKDYDKQSLAVQIGISRSSLYNILDNSNNRVDLSTLGKLLYFFHSEGLVISMSDLFVVTNEPEPTTSTTETKT